MTEKSANAYKLALMGALVVAFSAAEASATPSHMGGAERFPRWYVGVQAGGVFTQDTEVSGATNGDVSVENGVSYGGVFGYMPAYRTGPGGFRYELEIFHKESSLDSLKSAGTSTSLNGDFSSTSYMANVFYDINIDSAVLPYIGVGAGWADISLDTSSGLGNTSDSDDVFAWQALVGLNYFPVSIPYTIFNVGYRFHVTEDADFGTATTDFTVDAAYTHSVEAGMKFRF